MKRTLILTSIGAVALGTALLLARQGSTSPADQQNENGNGKGSAPLPIAQVVLFNSGVGYFQREGQIDGDGHIDLAFQVSDINDLLKSLILQDAGGGKVGTVSYDSFDPIDKTLHSFALDLSGNPTVGQILNQARGEKVEVVRQQPGAEPLTLFGTIVGMEVHNQTHKDHAEEIEQLNLLTSDGLRGVPLPQVQKVRFLNPTLDNEFRRALEVLARSHDLQKKSVRINFAGNGKRTVKVGYVVERPIWKTSYRLSLGEKAKLHLQGWALVENTSDDDWNSVRMVLVTGRPISFQMNLYQPLYVPRPWVEPELFASLRPPVYAGDMTNMPQAAAQGRPDNGFVSGLTPQGTLTPGLGGIGGGMPGFKGGAKKGKAGGGRGGEQDLKQAQSRLDFEELQRRRQQQAQQQGEAKDVGARVAGLNLKEGVASVATAEDIGDSYRYLIDQKVSLPRQKSAMLPVVNMPIEGSKISIYNPSVHAKFPLLGLRVKNTSGHPLMQGPITVYEEGVYAGDTRILDLQPNEERLVSYAVDLGTEVVSTTKERPGPEMTFRIGGNNLTAHYKIRQTRTYTVKNRSTQDRTVLIEHAIRSDWKLVADEKKEKVEKSRDVYRFPVKVAAGQSVPFEVKEEQDRVDAVALFPGDKDNPPRYAIAFGVEVRPVTKTFPEELTSVRIVKGVVEAQYRQREVKTYFIQNNSGEERNFTLDHVIRPDWRLTGPDGKEEKGPGVHRFVVKVPEGKTATEEVKEEHTVPYKDKRLGALDEAKLGQLLQSKVTPGAVRQAVEKTLAYQAELGKLGHDLKDAQTKLKEMSDDQARVRENLKILPHDSAPYKRFLEKFDKQETQIDQFQASIRQVQSTIEGRRKSYEEYLNTLSVP